MTTRSAQARAVEKRTAILDSSLELLLSEGPKGVTHRHVAAKAGVPVGSIGYYYTTREKLLATCYEHLASQQREAYERFTGGGTDLTDPVNLAEAFVEVIACGQPQRARVIAEAFIEGQREGGEVGAILDTVADTLRGYISTMLRKGGVENLSPDRVLQLVVGAAVTARTEHAPAMAVADLLRLAEK